MAACTVGAVAEVVEGSARLRLVLGVTVQAAQLCLAVRELALTSVLAAPALLIPAAELRLVAVGGEDGHGSLALDGGQRREARRRSHSGARGLKAFQLA